MLLDFNFLDALLLVLLFFVIVFIVVLLYLHLFMTITAFTLFILLELLELNKVTLLKRTLLLSLNQSLEIEELIPHVEEGSLGCGHPEDDGCQRL